MSEPCLVWITGLPSSGKSRLASALQHRLRGRGIASITLDGDAVREALVPRHGYDESARDQFYETLANLGLLLAKQGPVVLVPATAHRRSYRERARAGIARFLEVWVDVPLEEVRRRDTKGIYAGFAAGRTHSVPGEDLEYEPPLRPDVVARGGDDAEALEALVALVSAPKFG